jgi:hypothetical protein
LTKNTVAGVERSGNPGIWRNQITSSPRSGRQLFVIHHFNIIEIGAIAVARFAGWYDKSLFLPGVPLRSTPGSILTPAPQADNVKIHFSQKSG